MAKRVIIDTEECIGCESCVELCPEIFEFDEGTEKAVVIPADSYDEACVQEAIETCPVQCIHWEE